MIQHQYYHEHLEMFRKKYRQEDYYTTTQIIKITGVSERTVRYRLSKLKKKYEGNTRMLYKDTVSNRWYISKLIVDEFYSKYNPRTPTRFNQPWQSFITWVMRDSYQDDVHQYLINKVKEAFPTQDPKRDWTFAIEKTKRGVNCTIR